MHWGEGVTDGWRRDLVTPLGLALAATLAEGSSASRLRVSRSWAKLLRG